MILKPFEFLYHFLSDVKNVFYDLRVIEAKKLPVPVVSIGNLSFGGTGKTPFIELIAQEFKHLKVVIVCRSYKVESTSAQKVDVSIRNAAQLFGDEAVLLQKRLPWASVWSGPRKWQTAEVACQIEAPELILVDDGFSHRKLERQFDLVLLDVSRLGADYFREGWRSLKRAQAVVLTKTDKASAAQVKKLKDRLHERFSHLRGAVFEAQSKTYLDFSTEHPLFAFCGIANPISFRQSLLAMNYKIETFESYDDHQYYSEELQNSLAESFAETLKKNPQLKLVTTEKDFVKISEPKLLKHLQVAHYELQMPQEEKERLLEKIRQSL